MPRKLLRPWPLTIAAWAVLLTALGAWSAGHSRATIAGQSPIGTARTVMAAVTTQIRDGLPAGWRVRDDQQAETACSLTPVRDGTSATRTLTVTQPPDINSDPADVLTTLAHTLGPDTRMHTSEPGLRPDGFFYDAGDFVAVHATVASIRSLTITISSGCRPH